jgi:hypothetical protein
MSYDEFKTNFPLDIYSDENQMKQWPLGDLGASVTDSTRN